MGLGAVWPASRPVNTTRLRSFQPKPALSLAVNKFVGMSSVQNRFLSASDLLHRLQNCRLSFRQLQQIHAQVLTNRSSQSDSSLTHFLSSCARSQYLHYAALFLDNFPRPSLALWKLLLRMCVKSGADDGFLRLYKKLLSENVMPTRTTLSLVLQGCASLSMVSMCGSVHCQIFKMGFEFHRFLQTALLNFYGKVGDLNSAKRVFGEMQERDVIANNAMVSVLSKHGCVRDAMKLFDEMPERSSASWNTMISCYCNGGDVDSARAIFDKSPVKNVVSWNAMIDGYCKSQKLLEAQELFDQMGSLKNSSTWTTMITGYIQCREFLKAMSIFQQMQSENVRPTEVTMVSLLSACAHLGASNMGIWIHNFIKRHHFRMDAFLGNALIDMYWKCGDIKSALQIFHGLSTRNKYCWSSIIVGLGMHGYGREAIDAFHGMEKEGIRPDRVTFIGLLSGCRHSGLVSEGKHYFNVMSNVYGVEPGIEHYGCMVDLLGRDGLLEEALQLIKAMPMKPNAAVWGSLVRVCKIHKDIKFSEHVISLLLELDPNDGGNYVFLSNVYASLNRWNDVEICRKAMIERGVRKTPGCSSIEVNNQVHEFVAGDTSHPQLAQINEFLDEIWRRLLDMGHLPDTASVLIDIEEEEKENAVRYHSEMIAIAFGLMRTDQGKAIRIVKNLRVCTFCHSATKLISRIFNRVIIVRDRNRFHHYRDGFCSCRDHW